MARDVQWDIERGAARRLLSQRGVETMVQQKADTVLTAARRTARAEAYDTGAYAASFGKTSSRSKNGDRPVVVVEVSDWKWKLIEYGTRERPGKHILKRAMESAGLKFGRTP